MNRRIAVALGASMVLHGVALTWVVHKGLEVPGAAPAPVAAQGKLVMGRLVSPVQASPGPLPSPVQAAVPAALAPPESPAAITPPRAEAALPPAAAAAPAAPAAERSLAGFVPASQLSTRPVPIYVGELEPRWLDEIPGGAVVELSVYVAADGSVIHVEVRKGTHPRISEMARQAFAQARYKPGAVQGRNVAARVDVSLDYEARRERVADPDAPRPPGNLLGSGDIRTAPLLAPEVPQPSAAGPR